MARLRHCNFSCILYYTQFLTYVISILSRAKRVTFATQHITRTPEHGISFPQLSPHDRRDGDPYMQPSDPFTDPQLEHRSPLYGVAIINCDTESIYFKAFHTKSDTRSSNMLRAHTTDLHKSKSPLNMYKSTRKYRHDHSYTSANYPDTLF
jgi:hypothetical protein